MSLKDRLIRQIRMNGPMPVSAYMQTCLHDPRDGYYATRPGLGQDFITAPETSQIFGELLGLWATHEWQTMGRPSAISLVELGGGRGTLMADALRAIDGLPFETAMHVTLIEASPLLQELQASTLRKWSPVFKAGLEHVPTGYTIFLANEFLDCLPARQFVRDGENWRERVVGIGSDEALSFGIDASDVDPATLGTQPNSIRTHTFEVQPGLNGLVAALAARAEAGDCFRALFIDYGPRAHAPSDTLRAYRLGKQVHPFADPGTADLTVDVDFGRLARLAEKAGLHVSGPVTQGGFLGALGLQERLDRLIAAHPDRAEDLFKGASKLVDPAEMGERFKVICLSSPGLPAPVGL